MTKLEPGTKVRINVDPKDYPREEDQSAAAHAKQLARVLRWNGHLAEVIGDGDFEDDTRMRPLEDRPDSDELRLTDKRAPFQWTTASLEVVEKPKAQTDHELLVKIRDIVLDRRRPLEDRAVDVKLLVEEAGI